MESDYDQKFEEMKKYIPFLESMIRRLENTSSGSMNPRQAQLSKIRALRDLLLDRNKRMKMENLLKCEQVLINLYSKVEQRDTLPGINKAPQNMSPPPRVSPVKENLNKARKKLLEAAKSQALENMQDTLPEIARANQTEAVYSGSKEPALFQRRPNKPSNAQDVFSLSPSKEKEHSPLPKRNYTRVLVSPEPATEHRLESSENTLYQRRSPRKYESGSHHKKERKKEKRRSASKGSQSDLNITLQVPEDCLGKLNTEDIFDRIINCDNADVDIDTLRDLRAQILGELKQTGTMEDISDLILKSYSNKKKKKKKASKKKEEIEEGELSNSESEAIESIYGSLVIVDGEEGKSETNKKAVTKARDADAETRKIQIRLIISNTDKNQESSDSHGEKKVDELPKSAEKVDSAETNVHLEEVVPKFQGCSLQNQNKIFSPVIKLAELSPTNSSVKKNNNTSIDLVSNKEPISETLLSETVPKDKAESPKKSVITASPLKANKANFYNPIAEPEIEKIEKSPKATVAPAPIDSKNKDAEPPIDPEDYLKLTCDSSDEFKDEDLDELPKETQIPFLSEQSIESKPPKEPENVVSQIDILQALKNEILGESLSLPVAEAVTPALHQPKVTKVSNVKEIAVKKTISLEKYKQKSSQNPMPPKNKTGLFNSKHNEDLSQKPSRGLTAKECERFNFSSLVLNDLSDEEDAKLTNADVQDIYADLAPQSPDVEIVSDAGNESPVIIPADPVKASVAASSNTDVDMRHAGLPTHSPQNVVNSPRPSVGCRGQHHEQNNRPIESSNRPSDPRKRKDMFNPSLARDHSNSPVFNPAGTPRQNFPNMTPNMTPNARLLTPSHPHFDQDQSNRKHVYAPSLWDINDREQSGTKDRTKDVRGGYHLTDGRSPRWEEQNTRSNSVMRDDMSDHSNRDRYQRRPRMDPRLNDRRDDGYSRADCPPTPSHYFGRGDYPGTPNHPFGRSECPLTPSHPFGRPDGAPTTPKHPFGSGDCPPTPSHPFGMSDVPRTPSHPFGRSEYPVTPSHPFGRSECPSTPIHSFGRSGGFSQDPRYKRNYDEDDRSQTRDYNSYDKYGRQYSGSIEQRFGRDHGGRNDGNRRYSNDQRYAREPSVGRSRAPSVGRPGRDFERDRPYEEFGAGRHAANNSFDNRPPRERSVGRMVEQHHRSDSRAPSVGRTFGKDSKENTVSVESHAGRSFTIDTSVNATFQEFNFNELNWNRSFDARRQRAASVGRSLNSESSLSTVFNRDGASRVQIREGSVGRCLHREGSVGRSFDREGSVGRAFAKSNDDKFHSLRKTAFKRAQSVGRDLGPHTNFDHRARFESFKAMATEYFKNKREKTVDKHIREAPKVYHKEPPKPLKPNRTEPLNPRDPRSRKDLHDYQKDRQPTKNKKDAHSPKKNCRDLRNKYSKPNKIKYNDQRHDKKRADSYGIVYTNDNIARGNILGPGYGVKNYKIPKIKRPVEEIIQKVESMPKDDEKKEKRTEQTKESVKKKTSEKYNVERKTSEKNNVEKKTGNAIDTKTTEVKISKEPEKSEPKSIIDSEPRPQRKNRRRQRRKETSPPKLSQDSSPVRTRRSKRAVIYDSESDNNTGNTSDISDLKTKDNKAPAPRTSSPAKGKEVDDDLQFSFDIQDEDFHLFSGNLGSDNVIDNINDIIAELDKDIDVKEGDSITQIAKDNTLANILESLENAGNTDLLTESSDAQGSDVASLDSSTPTLKVITEATEPQGPQNSENTLLVSEKSTVVIEKETSVTTSVITVKDREMDDVVSTSIAEDDNIEKAIPETNEKHSEVCSTPDSTINTDELSEQAKAPAEKVPDGTIETQSEMNSVISSTHDNSEKSKENIADSKSSKMGSLGSILSLLQDKTKIKELLSMLDDQTDNEKIKKKLEKLSEIVSDDEEIEDKTITEIEEKDNTVVDVVKEKEQKEVTTISNDKDKEGDKAVTPQSKDFGVHEQTQDFDSKSDEAEQEAENISKINNTSKTDHSEGKKDDNISKTDKPDTSEELTDLNTSKPENTSKDDNLSTEEESDNEPIVNKTKSVRKTAQKRGKGKLKKSEEKVKKRVTRSSFGAQNSTATAAKKPNPLQGKKKSTELQKLQEDIRDMFISNDVLKATGIRMCRLAKITEQKNKNVSEESSPTKTNENSTRSDVDERSVTPSPVVVLEKIPKGVEPLAKPPRKKPGPKPKGLNLVKESEKVDPTKSTLRSKPGPKSKTRPQEVRDVDPYDFETDSINELTKGNENNSSDTDNESLASSQSLDSTDLLIEIKSKPKRKKCNWNKGVIKSRKTKKKDVNKSEALPQIDRPSSSASETLAPESIPAPSIEIPDWNCFTDKSYCFSKSKTAYTCRLCGSAHEAIVHHYKKQHPHYEIPLSRMNPMTAIQAIKQSMITNFQQISKVPVAKYVCRFCFLVFDDRRTNILESFFWHVVSTHTGEYKQLCAECTTVKKCTFMLDIPPPPQDKNGLLMGYICGKCNYTQVSLENLKNHVSLRHNDEETEVYTISLGAMTQKLVEILKSKVAAETLKSKVEEEPRTLRSVRSKPTVNYEESINEPEGEEKTARRPRSVQSKISFEGDVESMIDDSLVKSENEDDITHLDDSICDNNDDSALPLEEPEVAPEIANDTTAESSPELKTPQKPSDVFIQPHFMISFTETGNKEYLCCINGDNHYKTTLLISMKKHVQIKHPKEPWDGYCSVCNVIVTPQGVHNFTELLAHLLNTHTGNFPVLEKTAKVTPVAEAEKAVPIERKVESPRPYINVRPLTELITPRESETSEDDNPIPLPKIQSVISLNTEAASTPPPELATEIDSYQEPTAAPKGIVEYKYEEVQKEIMDNKHQIVLDSMMAQEKLTHVFKCAGRYCSFTCSEAESALVHASTHHRIGGLDAFRCTYCSFDASGNAIDLVSHVFKEHGSCRFFCKLCFYRAFSSPLVEAHYGRVHGTLAPGVILQSTGPSNVTGAEVEGLLSRQEAVRHYSCCFGKGDIGCKFKTYTPGKFCEHLTQKHSESTQYPCDECDFTGSSPTSLVQHQQTHGLQLYQCTWCVHGTDTEADMLSHASFSHPTKRPQAYLRHILETKTAAGGSKFKVLPFVHITKKSIIQPVEVPDSGEIDNPAREAARALELEKLIGHTTKIIEESTTGKATELQEEEDVRRLESVLETSPPAVEYPEIPADAMVLPLDSEESTTMGSTNTSQEPMLITIVAPPRQVTPPPPPIEKKVPISEQITPTLKIEPPDAAESDTSKTNRSGDVIYCLDSDEDEVKGSDSGPTVIDLSDDSESNIAPNGTPTSIPKTDTTDKRFPWAELFKCEKCQGIFKVGYGLKRHYISCYPKINDKLRCAHCPFTTDNKNDIVNHYVKRHGPLDKYKCGICNDHVSNCKEGISNHAATAHGLTKISFYVEQKGSDNKEWIYVMQQNTAPKAKGRRKRSSGEPATSTPAKLKRFGPDDFELLPINQIFDESVQCSLCEFTTKVRQNLVRHLQLHSQQQHVPQNAPVNPVPHLETNEMHFDKMLNLASSSVVPRTGDKSKPDGETTVALLMPPEAAAKYPVFVPDRKRFACGAKNCSYISLNEDMFKCHWETLHSGSNEYRCVHCPPVQQLDTTRPLTAARIMSHLKMHDMKLYACSACMFYHHQPHCVETHITEKHGGNGRIKAVRGPVSTAPVPPPQPSASAPTMDLKPWQCGLCQYKSMLRQEVVEHCSKNHHSKFQFKCAFCPWRSSGIDNVKKHHANSHAGQQSDVFYFYYREGSIPDIDGIPRWMKQRQKAQPQDPEVKAEKDPPPPSKEPQPVAQPAVDLNIVKKEAEEPESVEALCKRFGEFCEPNGLKYKCSLCKLTTEDDKEAMQSHLYEELKYRKWGCSICSYKAFHQKGLKEHAFHEHRQNLEPVQLAVDTKVETWVAQLLEHQEKIIQGKLTNLQKQKPITPEKDKTVDKPTTSLPNETTPTKTKDNSLSRESLESALGKFGDPSGGLFACPKCDYKIKEESKMTMHLESELNKLRWRCSVCPEYFHIYHEAQLHCKSVHPGQLARTVPTIRDPVIRNAWLTSVIQTQKETISLKKDVAGTVIIDSPEKELSTQEPENSLLVVRYEEDIPTPEEDLAKRNEENLVKRKEEEARQREDALAKRKRSAYNTGDDSDEERLVIDEPRPAARDVDDKCPYCKFSTPFKFSMHSHILRHYQLKPFMCPQCNFIGYNQSVNRHQQLHHVEVLPLIKVQIPTGKPCVLDLDLSIGRKKSPHVFKCLLCEKSVPEEELDTHIHPHREAQFAQSGDVVYKCCNCTALRKTLSRLREHHNTNHPNTEIKFDIIKLDERVTLFCLSNKCKRKFRSMESLKQHHESKHAPAVLKYKSVDEKAKTEVTEPSDDDEPEVITKPLKRTFTAAFVPTRKPVARKSTTKLPLSHPVARKSTTKLPFLTYDELSSETSESEIEEEYSYYGTRPPSFENYAKVTTLMPFLNTMMPFTLKKLSEYVDINPRVVLEDVAKSKP